MKYRIFKSDAPEAKAIIEECKKHIIKRNECRRKIVDVCGAVGLLAHDEINGDVCSIVFDHSMDNENWLIFDKDFMRNDKRYYAYKPNGKTEKGKELKRMMRDKQARFFPNRFLVNELGLSEVYVFGDTRMYYCTAGWEEGDILIVKIPDDKKTPFPSLPVWLKEVVNV